MPNKNSGRGLKWHFAHVFSIFIISAIFCGSGFFGFREATAYFSRDVFYRAWSVAYPGVAHSNSSVALITDESLEQRGVWPAPYVTHAVLLNDLLRYDPKAVMIDFSFIDERPDLTIKTFKEVLQLYAARRIPVYLAAASKASGALRPARSDIAMMAEEGLVRLVSVEAGTQYGQMYSYRLMRSEDGFDAAAPRIYRDLCNAGQLQKCAKIDSAEMEIWWASHATNLNCRLLIANQDACRNVSENPLIRLFRLAVNFTLGEYRKSLGFAEVDPIPVPFSTTALWREIRNGTVPVEVEAKLRGSVVFYGGKLAVASDEVYTPVSGRTSDRMVPGVYFHAMAFDNLTALADDHIKPTRVFGLSERGNDVLAALVCGFGALLGRFVLVGLGFGSTGLWRTTDLVMVPTFALIWAYFQFYGVGISPANWIGTSTAWAGASVMGARRLTNWMVRSPERTA